MKRGEKVVFGFTILIVFAGIAKGVKQLSTDVPKAPRDYYEWTGASLKGHTLYRKMGCNSCHRALGVGEIGVAPVLDGTGTRRTIGWLESYLTKPESLVMGTAHDGSLGPNFSEDLEPIERKLLAAFLFALKANPGSPNYPRPPLTPQPQSKI